MKVKLLTQEIY